MVGVVWCGMMWCERCVLAVVWCGVAGVYSVVWGRVSVVGGVGIWVVCCGVVWGGVGWCGMV